jgi:hypothetical protein
MIFLFYLLLFGEVRSEFLELGLVDGLDLFVGDLGDLGTQGREGVLYFG